MPTTPVLQPNGLYAIWSTVTDTFHHFNMTETETRVYLRDFAHYDPDEVDDALKHIAACGVAWFWAHDWRHYVEWLETEIENFEDYPAKLAEIDALGLPRRMDQKYTPLHTALYWQDYFRGQYERLSFVEIPKLERRIIELETQVAGL